MTIKQLSVFLENKTGRINDVAGSLSAILECLAVEQIFIEYMYAFAQGDTANVVIRPNDLKKCVQVLEKCQCDILNKNNL